MKKTILTSLSILLLGLILTNISCEKLEVKRVTKIKTGDATNVTANTATANGEFIDLGDNIESYGFCYNTTGDPTVDDSKVIINATAKKGTFQELLESISAGTTYFVKAYAFSDGKNVYGKQVSFTTPNPTITVTSPLSTSAWPLGSVQQITWTDNLDENVRIELWQKNGTISYRQITSGSVSSDGVYNWTIPNDLPVESGWRIKIISADDETIYGFSDEFNITDAEFISVISPTTGDNWNMGVSYTISWDDNIDGKVRISLLMNSTFHSDINDSTESDGIYDWAIPDSGSITAGTNYAINISSVNVPTLNNTGNDFEISAVSVIPTVTTNTIVNITYNSATSGGDVTDDGGDAVTARGVCWSTAQNPTTSDDITDDGTGTGAFTSSLAGLNGNTTYYVRAYATNSIGTAYGNEQTFATAVTPVITVTSPVLDDLWLAGDTYTIIWSNDNITDNVTIDLYKAGSYLSTIVTNITNTGSYTWPSGPNTPGTDYQIRVLSAVDAGIFDDSETFEIADPTITVNTPGAGYKWAKNRTHSITWTSNLPDTDVKIELDDGISPSTIVASTPNDGQYDFAISAGQVDGSNYSILITGITHTNITGVSGTFEIKNPFINITSPAGSENWLKGNTYEIIWDDNIPENVKILVEDVIAFPTDVVLDTESDGSYFWTIPGSIDAAMNPYTMRIESVLDAGVFDISPSFNIADPPFINVNAPTQGESLNQAMAYDIKWTSNFPENVILELWQGASLQEVINGNAPNTGTYSWNIPAGYIGQSGLKIKIIKNNDANVFGESGDFSVF